MMKLDERTVDKMSVFDVKLSKSNPMTRMDWACVRICIDLNGKLRPSGIATRPW